MVVQRAGRLCQGWRKHLTLPGPQRLQSFRKGRSMCLSAERSRAHLFYKRSAEKQGALLLCNRVKVGEFERRKVPSVIPFSVGLCSHHHLLPPRRAGWLPWSSAFSWFVFWCVELNPHLCRRTQRFGHLHPRFFGNPCHWSTCWHLTPSGPQQWRLKC